MKVAVFFYPSLLAEMRANSFGFTEKITLPESAVSIGEIAASGNGYVIPPTKDMALMVLLYSTCREALDHIGLFDFRMDVGPLVDGEPSWKPVLQEFSAKSRYRRKGIL